MPSISDKDVIYGRTSSVNNHPLSSQISLPPPLPSINLSRYNLSHLNHGNSKNPYEIDYPATNGLYVRPAKKDEESSRLYVQPEAAAPAPPRPPLPNKYKPEDGHLV